MAIDNSKLQQVINALQADESLLERFHEMINTVNDEQGLLTTGDDAEEAVIEVIQKTGVALLHKWAEAKEAEAATQATSDQSLRPQGKKKSVGTLP